MTLTAAVKWVEAPLGRFVEDARVQVALLLNTSGQALAKFGFARSMDVMSACALASAIHATATELGRLLDGRPFGGSHFAGRERQYFLAPIHTRQGTHILLCVFDEESSLGLVRIYFEELARALSAAAPAQPDERQMTAEDFERELNRNLATLFGRA